MKMLTVLFSALLLSPLAALGQVPPAGAPPGPDGQPGTAPSQAMRADFERIHLQARAQMLGVLSPAHRQLLGNVVAELAISPNPDVRGAAARIDAALTPNEAQAILAAESSARSQMEARFGAMQRHPMPAKPDAGRTLLRAAVSFGRPHAGEGNRP